MSDAPAPKTVSLEELNLQLGMVAEVTTPENKLIFVGRIEKLQDGAVSIREGTGETLPMVLVNKPVKVRFYREADNVVLQGKVCGSTATMWRIDRLESTFAQEQRGFFRQNIGVDIEAKCGVCPAWNRRPDKLFPCQVLDVSAGGILISCGQLFEQGDCLMVTEIPLVEGAPLFTFISQIKRVSEWKKDVYRYGCQFMALSPKEEDSLLQAIFTIQREEIRRRRGR